MKAFILFTALLSSLYVSSGETKKLKLGSITYEVELKKSYGSDVMFQTIRLKEGTQIFKQIINMIDSNQVKSLYGVPDLFRKFKTITTVELNCTSEKGFTLCTRDYIQVVANKVNTHYILIPVAEFNKVLLKYASGKHKAIGKGFLFDESQKVINSIVFS